MLPEAGDFTGHLGDTRVLTVVIDLGIGGTQRVAQNIAIELHRRGVPTALLAHGGGGPRGKVLADAGVQVFVDDAESTGVDAALAWRPDIVHIHRSGYENRRETSLMRRFKASGARIVETNIFARFDHSSGGRLIDAHCLLTEWCLFKWAAWGGRAATKRRAYVVPNAVDPDAFAKLDASQREVERDRLGVPRERFLLGRVGQPIPAKWSTMMLDAFAEAVARGLDVGLLLVGAPDNIRAAAAKLPAVVRSRIVLRTDTSSDTELATYYSALDGMLHVSQIGETFGMVLCEAMLLGKPVVTLSTPFKDNGQLEVVGHERGGLVALQPVHLFDAIRMLVTDTTLYRRLAEQSPEWVRERFGTGIVVDKLCRIYASVVSGVEEPGPASFPDSDWAAEMASRGIGRSFGRRDQILLQLLHLPAIYRPYLLLRRAMGRL